MALFAQENNLEDLVIFLDEPENHLHPGALIDVLDKITSHVTNGQVWIATHSVNVLAHFDPSNIWYMDNGEVSYAGNIPRKVLEGLLGNEEEILRLSNFLALPAEMASAKFAYESLFYPKVVITSREDHQVAQIYGIISERITTEEKLKVLDYGMGKGRLLSTIYENERLRDSDVTKWLDFYGYDKFETNKDYCIKVFEEVYGTSDRYFNETSMLLTVHDEKTLDFIVMCNVFHEIPPSDWLDVFNSADSVFNLLKEDGYLLIIEDQFLAVGEKAHSLGFLVYEEEEEFKALFKITVADNYKSTDYRNDGRLKSHHIPKSCINRIDSDSKKESMDILFKNAKKEIQILRKEDEPTFKTGKLHGFWAQQLVNVSLALEKL